MSKTISIVNPQNAAGKSTTAWHLAHALSCYGRKVLLVDADPMSGLEMRLTSEMHNSASDGASNAAVGSCCKSLLAECLEGKADVTDAITMVDKGLSVIIGSEEVVRFEISGINCPDRELRMSQMLDAVSKQFDYIVIDTPSSVGLLTINALAASDSVIVPLCCDYFGMDGVDTIMSTIKTVSTHWNERLTLERFLVTRYDRRLRAAARNLQELIRNFEGMLFDTVIIEGTDLAANYAELASELLTLEKERLK